MGKGSEIDLSHYKLYIYTNYIEGNKTWEDILKELYEDHGIEIS